MGCAYVRCIRPEQVDFKALWDFGTDGVYSWSGGCITTTSPEMLVSDRSFYQLHVPVNFCQGTKGNRMWDLKTMFETTITDIVNCSCRCEYAFNSLFPTIGILQYPLVSDLLSIFAVVYEVLSAVFTTARSYQATSIRANGGLQLQRKGLIDLVFEQGVLSFFHWKERVVCWWYVTFILIGLLYFV